MGMYDRLDDEDRSRINKFFGKQSGQKKSEKVKEWKLVYVPTGESLKTGHYALCVAEKNNRKRSGRFVKEHYKIVPNT